MNKNKDIYNNNLVVDIFVYLVDMWIFLYVDFVKSWMNQSVNIVGKQNHVVDIGKRYFTRSILGWLRRSY